MSDVSTVVNTGSTQLAIPVPAIICIAIGAYLVLIIILLIIRSILISQGVCVKTCRCFGKEGEPCCDTCCAELGDCCNCCASPSLTACLDSICPARQQMDCADIVTCQCCADNQCCPCCDASQCDCGQCQCQCGSPDCNDVGCCCCKLQTKQQWEEED